VISILGGGVAGAGLARAPDRRRRPDVVVFAPPPLGSGSTAGAMGEFRTQHGSTLNIKLSLAAREYFAVRAERIGFQANGYLYLADDEASVPELERRARLQRELGLPIEHPDPRTLVPFLEIAGIRAANYCTLDAVYEPLRLLRLMVEEARQLGADFRYGAEAAPADLEAEIVVVAAGRWSNEVG